MFLFLTYMSRGEIAGSQDNSLFNFLKNCQIVFDSRCTSLHSHQQCMKVLIFLHPDHYLLSFFIVSVLLCVCYDFSHFNGCKVASHCGCEHFQYNIVTHQNGGLHIGVPLVQSLLENLNYLLIQPRFTSICYVPRTSDNIRQREQGRPAQPSWNLHPINTQKKQMKQ